MKSIDNLREYVASTTISAWTQNNISQLIDAIEREVDDMWHALTIDAKPMTDENMAESGWVRLPVDSDGVPIHVGDVMEWPYGNGEFRVNGIGGNTLFYIDKDSGECEWTDAEDKHHHHATSAELVLAEFADKVVFKLAANGWNADEIIDSDMFAEYAAKLTLRGDE